jgi:hypothetical protein
MDLLDVVFLFLGRLVWGALKIFRLTKGELSYGGLLVLGFFVCVVLVFSIILLIW